MTQQVSRPDQIIIGFRPVIEIGFDEDVFLHDRPVNVLNNLTEAVPLIIGINTAEGAFFLTGEYISIVIVPHYQLPSNCYIPIIITRT